MTAIKLIKTWLPLILGLSAGAILALLLVDLPRLVSAQGGPVDNTITYQGRLKLEEGEFDTYVDGTCDFQFDLYADSSGGTPLTAQPLTRTLTVSDGYFKADLDFGDQYVSDQSHYLAVAVDCAGDAGWITMSVRVPLHSSPYAQSVPWEGLRPTPVITDYVAGNGLALTNTVFSVVTSTIQQRITGVCPADQKIVAVNSDGSVTCAPDQNTIYNYGAGLKVIVPEISKFHVDVNVVQARMAPCPDGQALRVIDADGGVACEEFVSEVIAGDGLTLPAGSGGIVLSVDSITTTFIADDAVTSAKIDDGTVQTSDIGPGEVTTADIANDTIIPQDIATTANGCGSGSPFEYFGTNWGCGNATVFTTGHGLQFSGTQLNVVVADFAGDGLTDDTNNNLDVDFAGTGSASTAAYDDHGHGTDYGITMGTGSVKANLIDDTTGAEYLFPPTATYNLSQPSTCLVVVNTYLDGPGNDLFPGSEWHESWLRPAIDPDSGPPEAPDYTSSSRFYYDYGHRVPSVSTSHVWTGLSGLGKFGCYYYASDKRNNDNETLVCRVSFVCQTNQP